MLHLYIFILKIIVFRHVNWNLSAMCWMWLDLDMPVRFRDLWKIGFYSDLSKSTISFVFVRVDSIWISIVVLTSWCCCRVLTHTCKWKKLLAALADHWSQSQVQVAIASPQTTIVYQEFQMNFKPTDYSVAKSKMNWVVPMKTSSVIRRIDNRTKIDK